MSCQNPFQYGRELGTDELVDREEEIARILRTVTNRGKLFLIGPRRFGKTSILKTAGDELRTEGAVILRFDVEAYGGPGQLAEAILTASTRALTGPVERVSRSVQSFFGALRPELSMDPDQTITVGIGHVPDVDSELPTLVEVLDGLDRLAADDDDPVALILDEFQYLVETDSAAERQIRACVQRHRHVAYIFAGSDTRLMAAMTGSPKRPFYKLGDRLFVGPLPHEDFRRFVEGGFTDAGFGVDPAVVEVILDRAEEVPYNVQQLAHECWEQVRTSETERLTAETVDTALERIVRAADPFYTKLWTGLTRPQQKAVRAVVEHGGQELFSQAVSRRHDLPVATMQSALERLVERGVVREERRESVVRYRLEDPFVGAWLRLVQAL